MSAHESELAKRLLDHEPIEETRQWFLKRLVDPDDPIKFSDLSKLEQMFLKDAMDAYAIRKKL
jgi:hypothetical protein